MSVLKQVRVDVQSDVDRAVPHLQLDVLEILSMGDLETAKGVPQIVKSKLAEFCTIDCRLKSPLHEVVCINGIDFGVYENLAQWVLPDLGHQLVFKENRFKLGTQVYGPAGCCRLGIVEDRLFPLR